MALAREVTDYLLKHHRDIVAVLLEGSTAKGEDRDHSDLEMSVITKSKSETRYYQCIFEGIVIEAGFAAEDESLAEAGRLVRNWPIAADARTGSVALYDPHGLLPRLAALAANPDWSSASEAFGATMTSFYEDVCKMRNFVAAGEDRMARFMGPHTVRHAANFLGLLNRQHFNGDRNLLTKPRDFTTVPPHFWDDYPALLASEGSARELLAHAERLYNGCRELWVATGLASPPATRLEDALDRGRVARRD